MVQFECRRGDIYIQVQKQVKAAIAIFHLNGISGAVRSALSGLEQTLALWVDWASEKSGDNFESLDIVRTTCPTAMGRVEDPASDGLPLLSGS
jgi:hypothetical protein